MNNSLKRPKNIDNIRYIDYEYDEGGNRSRKIVKNNSAVYLGETTEYLYNNLWKDQLTEIKVNGGSRYFFKYDSCGNPTHYKVTSSTASANMKWNSPRQLASFTKNGVVYDYKYTASGERISKNVGNEHRQFYLDGTKIMGEDWGDYKIRYTYDSNGLRGFRLFKGNEVFDFDYVLDPFGNVIQVVYGDINKRANYIVGEYSYDAFGNRTIVKDLEIAGMKMSEINPFYWKSHYFDLESGLYCINCKNFYDPETGRYINARNLGYGVKNITEFNSFNAYILECNPIIYPANSSTIVPSIALYAEIDYSRVDEEDYVDQKYNDERNGWKIVAGVAIITGLVIGSIFTGGALSVVLAGATIGALGGGIGATVSTAISGDWNNFGNSFLTSTITGGISGAIGATGLGIGVQIGANALFGVGNYAATTALNGGQFTLGGIISSTVFGGIAGAIGGSGLMDGSNNMVNAFISFTGKNYLATMTANISSKIIIKSLIRISINAIIISGVLNGLYYKYLIRNKNSNENFIGW